MSTPIEGFFDRVDMVAEAMAFASPTAAQRVPVKIHTPSTKPVLVDKGTHIDRASEPASIPARTPTPQKGATSLIASQPEIESPATPFVISMSDPFAALSQAVKDGSFLVVTPLSIPGSATCGLDADLSSEEVLEDSDDEPTMRKRVFDFDEEEKGGDHETKTETIGTYLSYLLSFPFTFCHCLFLPSSFYMYLPNLLLQSPFILYICCSDCRDS